MKLKKILSLSLALIIVLSLPFATFANKSDFAGNTNKGNNSSQLKYNDYQIDGNIKELKQSIEALEIKLDLKECDESYELAEIYEKMTDEEALLELDRLKEELANFTLSSKALEKELKNVRNEIRKTIKSDYSQSELDSLQEVRRTLERNYEDIKVLDVDSIISNNIKFKFDTPPVIKGGRTLIPVSALVNGFGADVKWIAEERKVEIRKDGILIEIYIDSNITYVNGKKVILDTKATIMNNRTIVPLRFIAETLHLKVRWNQEDETIEIDDSDTTLIVNENGFRIIGTRIFLPEGTTREELDNVLVESEGGSYTFEDKDENNLFFNEFELLNSDRVISLSSNGYTEEIYTIDFSSNNTTLSTTGGAISINTFEIKISEDITRIELETSIVSAVDGSFILENGSGGNLIFDNTEVEESNVIISIAEDEITKQEYTIVFISETSELVVDKNGFSIDNNIITLPLGTSRKDLYDALDDENNISFILKDKNGYVLGIDATLISDTDIVVLTSDNEIIYTIEIN